MPPSKARDDELYDPRMAQVPALAERTSASLDRRELLYQNRSTCSSSRRGAARLSLEEIREVYRIDEVLALPPPRQIGLFDDLLTSGAHFRAAKDLLLARFPEVPMTGIFLARCLH